MRRLFTASLCLVTALAVTATPALATGNPGPHHQFLPFFTVLRPQPTQSSPYWSIPSGDGVQYFGQVSDPDGATFVESVQQGLNSFARLRLEHDVNFTEGVSYNNAEIAGVPTGYSQGSGDQLYCHSEGHKVTFIARARWNSAYTNGSAVGSTGFGLWNSPVTSQGVGPAQTAFLQWVPQAGLSTVVTAVVDNQTQILAFNPVTHSVDMTDWHTYKIEIERLQNQDKISYFVWENGNFVSLADPVTTPEGIMLGCGTTEMWVDDLEYDEFGNLSMKNPTTSQYMDIDFMRVEQE